MVEPVEGNNYFVPGEVLQIFEINGAPEDIIQQPFNSVEQLEGRGRIVQSNLISDDALRFITPVARPIYPLGTVGEEESPNQPAQYITSVQVEAGKEFEIINASPSIDLNPTARKRVPSLMSRKRLAQQSGDATLLFSSPAWMVAASQHIGTGGPEKPPQATEYNDVKDFDFHYQDAALSNAFFNTVEDVYRPVDVVILDTAPPLNAFQRTINYLDKAKHQDHPLRKLLGLGPNAASFSWRVKGYTWSSNKLTVHVANGSQEFFKHFKEIAGYRVTDPKLTGPKATHDYDMSNHGLFVAGIINSIAGDRVQRIHLVQVLNNFGVGSVSTVMEGLNLAMKLKRRDVPMVINISLTMALPIDDHVKVDLPADALAFVNDRNKVRDVKDLIDRTFIPNNHREVTTFENIQLAGQWKDVYIVGSAGNDSDRLGQVPTGKSVRYPAASTGVLGVGATDADGQHAWYSNISELQPTQGIITLGGSSSPNNAQAQGILGVWIDKLPDAAFTPPPPAPGTPVTETNPDACARWSGTSFATPIVTGTLARLASKMYQMNNAIFMEDVVDELKHPLTRVASGEKHLKVKQGAD